MEGLLARWALAIQEYEFTIHYCNRHENGNADALSQRTYSDIVLVAATSQVRTYVRIETQTLHQQQLTDPVIQQLHTALSQILTNMLFHKALSGVNFPSSTINCYGHSFSLVMGLYVCRQYATYLLSLFL